MGFTAAQRAFIEHDGRLVRGLGGPATGRTTALVERWLRLVEAGAAAGRTVLVARHRAAASAARDAIVSRLRGGFEALPVSTFHGLAYDALVRAGRARRLLSGSEQWGVVARLLSTEGGDEWPTLRAMVGRRAFVDEVARAVLELEPTHPELAGFAVRYRAHLAATGLADATTLLTEGAGALAGSDRFDHVLVDDYDAATAPIAAVFEAVAARAATVAVTGDSRTGSSFLARLPADLDVTFTDRLRVTAEPPSLVTCRHPSVEPETIAAELLAAHDAGTPWAGMAVLVRRPAQRGRAISRALARHGIPVATAASGGLAGEPVVRGLADLFRWVEGDTTALDRVLASPLAGIEPFEVRSVRREARLAGIDLSDHPRLAHLRSLRDALGAEGRRSTPAQLAVAAFRQSLGTLVADPAAPADPIADRAIDAVVAFVAGLTDFTDQFPDATLADYLDLLDGPEVEPDPWRVQVPAHADAVTITSIAGAAGLEWDTVILAGCVEGELPRLAPHPRFFERTGDDPVVRRRQSLDQEARLFELAATRARRGLVATCGPEPGVLPSRYVEGWPERKARLAFRQAATAPLPVAPTPGTVPIWPDGRLSLSASQLNTWADCHRKYGYTYALRTRTDGNLWADFGTLVHAILREFLDPDHPTERTWERLTAVAEAHWTDEIAPYRPQREEARRDLFEVLANWWEREGSGPLAPDVVAVERGFVFEVGPHKVTGSIDRVDRSPDGGGIEVVDYKTGRRQLSEDDAAVDIQLATYHLAATRDPALAAIGPPRRLRLLYLRTMDEREQPIRPGHARATELMVKAAAGAILTEDFTPSVEADCDHCDFHRLCPLQAAGREVGA